MSFLTEIKEKSREHFRSSKLFFLLAEFICIMQIKNRIVGLLHHYPGDMLAIMKHFILSRGMLHFLMAVFLILAYWFLFRGKEVKEKDTSEKEP